MKRMTLLLVLVAICLLAGCGMQRYADVPLLADLVPGSSQTASPTPAETDLPSLSPSPSEDTPSPEPVLAPAPLDIALDGYWQDMAALEKNTLYGLEFFDDGEFSFREETPDNASSYGGRWTMEEPGMARLTPGGEEQGAPVPAPYRITVKQDGDVPFFELDGRKLIKTVKPQDYIRGRLLYVNYASELPDAMKPEAGTHRMTYKGEEKVIIQYTGTMTDFCIFVVEFDGQSAFTSGETLFTLDKVTAQERVECTTTIPEGAPFMAVSFIDETGVRHNYVLGYNGRTGGVNAIGSVKIDVSKPAASWPDTGDRSVG